MSHPTVAPAVPVTLDKERSFKLDFNAFIYMEQEAGFSIADAAMWAKMKMKDLRVMVAAALRHEDPSVTPAMVGKLLHMGNLQGVMTALGKTWQYAMGCEEVPLRPLLMRQEAKTEASLPA